MGVRQRSEAYHTRYQQLLQALQQVELQAKDDHRGVCYLQLDDMLTTQQVSEHQTKHDHRGVCYLQLDDMLTTQQVSEHQTKHDHHGVCYLQTLHATCRIHILAHAQEEVLTVVLQNGPVKRSSRFFSHTCTEGVATRTTNLLEILVKFYE